MNPLSYLIFMVTLTALFFSLLGLARNGLFGPKK